MIGVTVYSFFMVKCSVLTCTFSSTQLQHKHSSAPQHPGASPAGNVSLGCGSSSLLQQDSRSTPFHIPFPTKTIIFFIQFHRYHSALVAQQQGVLIPPPPGQNLFLPARRCTEHSYTINVFLSTLNFIDATQ